MCNHSYIDFDWISVGCFQMKQKILFICTHNSARSQMAEAFLNKSFGDKYEAFSAGTEPTKINPYVVKVMADLSFNLSKNRAKSANEFLGKEIDYVVTVCDGAKATCPFFPGSKKYTHHSFSDPSTFTGSEEEILSKVRQIRDEIRDWIENSFKSIDD